jgi:hypothetical protein
MRETRLSGLTRGEAAANAVPLLLYKNPWFCEAAVRAMRQPEAAVPVSVGRWSSGR